VSKDTGESSPKPRPVWLRIVVQIGLALVLPLVALLLGRVFVSFSAPLVRPSTSSGASVWQMLGPILAIASLPYAVTGALSALLTWVLVRRAWDWLGYCALHSAFVSTVGIMSIWTIHGRQTSQQRPWFLPMLFVSQILALFAGAVIAALVLRRRRPLAETRPTDAAAFLP
jgi:hypothetical protein